MTIQAEKFQKDMLIARYWLLGRARSDSSFYTPIEALEYATKYHTGFRNDGVTPASERHGNTVLYCKSLI